MPDFTGHPSLRGAFFAVEQSHGQGRRLLRYARNDEPRGVSYEFTGVSLTDLTQPERSEA